MTRPGFKFRPVPLAAVTTAATVTGVVGKSPVPATIMPGPILEVQAASCVLVLVVVAVGIVAIAVTVTVLLNLLLLLLPLLIILYV